jgi:prepilin-type processing-associated H-X9-DG protein
MNNLKQQGLVVCDYAEEYSGYFPYYKNDGRWFEKINDIYPEVGKNFKAGSCFICPNYTYPCGYTADWPLGVAWNNIRLLNLKKPSVYVIVLDGPADIGWQTSAANLQIRHKTGINQLYADNHVLWIKITDYASNPSE